MVVLFNAIMKMKACKNKIYTKNQIKLKKSLTSTLKKNFKIKINKTRIVIMN